MSALARMLDVNANRSREALRVMEDAARFGLDDADLCRELKALRHDLRNALRGGLPEGWIEAHRDTPGDVGTAISTDAELSRGNLLEIVIAAGKRLTEALRVLEECSKTIDAGLAREIESLRYRAYEVDQRLTLRLGSGKARQWRLCLLLTKSLCRRPWREVLTAAIAEGSGVVQVREKEMDGCELAAHVREVISVAKGATACPAGQALNASAVDRSHGLPFGTSRGTPIIETSRGTPVSVIVDDRADVALACGADGVHLGQSDLSVRDVRRIAGRTLIVGMSTHDMNEADRAVRDGADYCGVGAIFASSTKQRATSGIAYLKAFIERYPHTPHLAIGGITGVNAGEVIAAGARGLAVSSAICGVDDPRDATRGLMDAIAGAKPQACAAAASAS